MLRLHECSCRHSDDGTRYLSVDISNVGHIGIVGDIGDIDIIDIIDDRIASVDVGEIIAAHRIRGSVDLAWAEGKPCNSTTATH